MNKTDLISRRSFIAGTGVAGPMILRSGVLAAQGRPGANDRIVIGHIGLGGMGSNHIKGFPPENIGALCDVDTEQMAKAAALVQRKIPMFTDYRRLLERKDIDAVVIATPNHWHGLIAIHACEAGKHVYVEKPASQTIEEGRAMVKAARRYKRVMQVGSQGRSHPAGKAVRKYIQDGMLGRVTLVECWHNDNSVGGDPLKMGDPPKSLDWDRWLGPVQKRPYNPDYCHRLWRWMFDLGGGQINDRGPHVLSLVAWYLGLESAKTVRVTATGDVPLKGLWNCPINFKVVYEFKDPDLKVVWSQPGKKAIDFEFGTVYHGTKDNLIVGGGDGRVFPEDKVEQYVAARNGTTKLPKGVRAHELQRKNWEDCIRNGETPIMDIEAGHRVATLCSLANIAYSVERPILWNARHERIENDETVNRLLGNPGRGKYHL